MQISQVASLVTREEVNAIIIHQEKLVPMAAKAKGGVRHEASLGQETSPSR